VSTTLTSDRPAAVKAATVDMSTMWCLSAAIAAARVAPAAVLWLVVQVMLE